MIKAILVDDEKHSIATLESEIKRHCPEIEIIATAQSAEKGIQLIKSLNPDLVFLDIEMPWMNGFEMLQEIGDISFDVIFVTAYDSYAIEAFKFSAIGYLMKPVQADELKDAVNRIQSKSKAGIDPLHLNLLLQNLQHSNDRFPKIALATADSLEFVRVEDIIRCESDKNYTYVFMREGNKHFLSKTLKEMETMLKKNDFIRTHQSHLINPIFIKRFVKTDGGFIVMEDDSKVAVSRAKKEIILQYLQNK